MRLTKALLLTTVVWAAGRGADVPAGTVLDVRLLQSISSSSSKKGMTLDGVLVAPVREGEEILLPMGAKVSGVLSEVRSVGIGLVRETASIGIELSRVELPNGEVIPITCRLIEIENARETVDAKGRVRGIRSTGTLAHRASGFVASFAAFDPIALAFTMASMASIVRFSDPEIFLPPGAELLFRLEAAIRVEQSTRSAMPAVAASLSERDALRNVIKNMPSRAVTVKQNTESDFVNVLFVGRRVALERAFAAAGWVQADALSAGTTYRSMRALAENQAYSRAPMSTLLLDDREPDYAYAKTLNSFAKRHHVRIWARTERWNGQAVWLGASTQDIGITFRGHTHVIDGQIDNERAKVVNDLTLTGCVEGLDLIGRPWIPREALTSSGSKLVTDTAIAVVRLKDCTEVDSFADGDARPLPPRMDGIEKVVRQSVLTFRNDVIRGNVLWRGVEGAKYLWKHSRPQEPAEERPQRDIEIASDVFSEQRAALIQPFVANAFVPEPMVEPARPAGPVAGPSARWTPPMVELALSGGSLGHGASIGDVGLSFVPKNKTTPSSARSYTNLLDPGWLFAASVTLNAHRLISHEWGFAYQQGKFHLEPDMPRGTMINPQHAQTGIITQEFSYNTLFHIRVRSSRIRPYVAVGPVVEMIRLTGSGMKATGVFRFGLKDIGMIRAAYDFGKNAPFDGGGVFQPGFQYGGGIRYRVAPRWTIRADLRQTVSPQPRLWSKATAPATSEVGEGTLGFTPDMSGKFHQSRFTLGFAFTF